MGKQIEEDQIGTGIRSETEREEATETEAKRENGKKTKITIGKETEIDIELEKKAQSFCKEFEHWREAWDRNSSSQTVGL